MKCLPTVMPNTIFSIIAMPTPWYMKVNFIEVELFVHNDSRKLFDDYKFEMTNNTDSVTLYILR